MCQMVVKDCKRLSRGIAKESEGRLCVGFTAFLADVFICKMLRAASTKNGKNSLK